MIKLPKKIQIGLGLILRILLLLGSTGGFAKFFYSNFLDSLKPTIDPWTDWIESGGRVDSFPYGLVLFFILVIVNFISNVIGAIFGVNAFVYVFASTIILCDLIIVKVLQRFTNTSVSMMYLFSPLVIYVNIIYLQTDAIVGMFMLLFSILLLIGRSRNAGIFLGLAIGCKFGVVIVLPFLVIFGLFNRRLRSRVREVLIWSLGMALLAYLPVFWSPGFRQMVFGTSESANLIEVAISMGDFELYLFPAIFILLCVWIYRNARSSVQLALGFIGASLFSLGLFSESAIGWFLWGIPIMIFIGIFTRIGTGVLFFALQVLVISRDIFSNNLTVVGYELSIDSQWVPNLLFTITIALGSAWTLSALRDIMRFSDVLNLIKKPLTIAIAGDSGVGKDTLVNSVINLLGTQSVTAISGDAYHKHERGHQKWSVNTHLNPNENHLEKWQADVKRAVLREDLYVKMYDHSNGRFKYLDGERPKDVVVSQGLHAMYFDDSDIFDLKIYLEMQESVRVKFKLMRDGSKRNQRSNRIKQVIEQRRKDYKKYILTQKNLADINIMQHSSRKSKDNIDLLIVESKDSKLATFLYSHLKPFVHQIQVDSTFDGISRITIKATNHIKAPQLIAALELGFKSFYDYFDMNGVLEDGTVGLIAVIAILSVFYKRGVNN